MIKPDTLNPGDKIAIVSLSWGGLGDKKYIHKYYIAKERLENDFNLEVVVMPHALAGSKFIYEHPEARAKDLMDAFQDDSIKAIFCTIGGDDTIRLLPYIDYEEITNHPKIFMGYSDTTVNHFMMNKAGIISFYGPTIMCEIGEYTAIPKYTVEAIKSVLFQNSENYEIKSSPFWSKEEITWDEKNIEKQRRLIPEEHGYELLQGHGTVRGELLGGCIDVFPMIVGTEIWPTTEKWKNKILLIETSEEKPSPELLKYYLRNLGAQGILKVIKGILVGKPKEEAYYDEYKDIYHKVMREYDCEELPILYNINIGHSFPIGILPLGSMVEINYDEKTITLKESPTKIKQKSFTRKKR